VLKLLSNGFTTFSLVVSVTAAMDHPRVHCLPDTTGRYKYSPPKVVRGPLDDPVLSGFTAHDHLSPALAGDWIGTKGQD